MFLKIRGKSVFILYTIIPSITVHLVPTENLEYHNEIGNLQKIMFHSL